MLGFTQTWAGSRPVFFVDGKRVSLEVGYNVMLSKEINSTTALSNWLNKHIDIKPSYGCFYIVDDFDVPSFRRVAQKIDGNNAVYLHASVRSWQGLKIHENSTHLSEFGIESSIQGSKVKFTSNGESTATYEDGERRFWQSYSGKSAELYLWHKLTKKEK